MRLMYLDMAVTAAQFLASTTTTAPTTSAPPKTAGNIPVMGYWAESWRPDLQGKPAGIRNESQNFTSCAFVGSNIDAGGRMLADLKSNAPNLKVGISIGGFRNPRFDGPIDSLAIEASKIAIQDKSGVATLYGLNLERLPGHANDVAIWKGIAEIFELAKANGMTTHFIFCQGMLVDCPPPSLVTGNEGSYLEFFADGQNKDILDRINNSVDAMVPMLYTQGDVYFGEEMKDRVGEVLKVFTPPLVVGIPIGVKAPFEDTYKKVQDDYPAATGVFLWPDSTNAR